MFMRTGVCVILCCVYAVCVSMKMPVASPPVLFPRRCSLLNAWRVANTAAPNNQKDECINDNDSSGSLPLSGVLVESSGSAASATLEIDLDCFENNCAHGSFGDDCKFDVDCGAFGVKDSDDQREQKSFSLPFVKGQAVTATASE